MPHTNSNAICVTLLEHIAVSDFDLTLWSIARIGGHRTQLVNYIHTLGHVAEDGVLVVKVGGWTVGISSVFEMSLRILIGIP